MWSCLGSSVSEMNDSRDSILDEGDTWKQTAGGA
jgi:hypothetical protein